MKDQLKARITDRFDGEDYPPIADALDAVLDLCEEHEVFAAAMGKPHPHWITAVYQVIEREL